MARLYLPYFIAGEPVPMKPVLDAAWWNPAGQPTWRARMTMQKNRSTMGTVSHFEDLPNDEDRNICLVQFISDILAIGVPFGGGFSPFQCRFAQTDNHNNMFPAFGLRVIAADAVTVRATIKAVARGSLEAATTLTNRNLEFLMGSWTPTVFGDRAVLELGLGGQPDAGSWEHSCSMRFGDAGGADLPVNDTSTDDYNPWTLDVSPTVFAPLLTIQGTTLQGATLQ